MGRPSVSVVDYTTGKQLDITFPDAFQRELVAFLDQKNETGDPLAAGDLQMLGFGEVKSFLGDAWDQVREDIYKLVEEELAAETGEGDLYFRSDDERYVLLFRDLTPEQSDRKAKAIGKRVIDKLSVSQAPGNGLVTARCRVVEVDRDVVDPGLQPAELASAIGEAVDRGDEAKRLKFEDEKAKLKPLYWPMTNVAKGLISFYRTEIVSESQGSTEVSGSVVYEFDRFGLERLSHDLSARKGPKNKALALLSIHFETIAERSTREQFLDEAMRVDKSVRNRLALELADAPENVSQARLNQVFTELSPYFIGFVCRFPIGFRSLSRLEGLKLLGLSLNGSGLGKERPRKPQFKELKRFVDQAKERRIRTFFLGALSVEIARAARRAEFDYVDGPGVLQPLPIPGRVFIVR